MYKGKQGKLIFTEDGKYALETPTEIIEISKQGKTQVAPESSLFDLGLTPISIIDNIGELITVDNKVYRVNNLNLTTDTVTINGVDYEIQRTPKKKQVNGVAYMSNQAAIRVIDEKIMALSEEIAQRREAGQPEGETVNDYVRTNATKTFELDQLIKDRTRLVTGNKRRVVTGGNVNDIIFVINKATAFQNFKGDSTETRLEDRDELKSMFGSDATFNALTSLFEGAPAALSKVFEEGFDTVTPEEIARINDWATATFMLAERQALVNEDEEIQNAISFLSNLINSIKLVELNKDGQVNPKSETKETQPGAPQSVVPKSGSRQPTNVPGSEAGQTGGTSEEIEKRQRVADIITTQLDLGVELPQILDTLAEQGYVEKINNSSFFQQSVGRDAIVFNIDGAIIPVYRSSQGTSSKAKGQWYPFFFNGGDWLVKAGADTYKNGYNNPIIKQILDSLNKNYSYEKSIANVRGDNQQLLSLLPLKGLDIDVSFENNSGIYDFQNYLAIATILKDWQSKLGNIDVSGYQDYLDGASSSLIKTNPTLKSEIEQAFQLVSDIFAELTILEEPSNLSGDAIKDINKKVLGPIQTERSQTLVGYPKVKAEFDNANQDTIDEVYFDFVKDAIVGLLTISPEAIEIPVLCAPANPLGFIF
jgi:hypothetical protein